MGDYERGVYRPAARERLADKKEHNANSDIGDRECQHRTGKREAGKATREFDRDPSPDCSAGDPSDASRKLEKRSPAIAALPTTTPIFHSKPTNGAHADVTKIDETNAAHRFRSAEQTLPVKNLTPKSMG